MKMKNGLMILVRSFILLTLALGCFSTAAEPVRITAKVLAVHEGQGQMRVEVVKSEPLLAGWAATTQVDFNVGLGDVAIAYLDRTIQADAVYYNQRWNLERIFPIDLSLECAAVNSSLRLQTAAQERGTYVKLGMPIPEFVLIDQDGDFVGASDFKGRAFVLNFIFTRCRAATMCPASTARMAELQRQAGAAGLSQLEFVTISFDPEYDSPGILRQYAADFGIELDNFHLLTGSPQVVDDLLHQFGILTREEAGTIQHTMATLLIDASGRVALRKEGQRWQLQDFLQAAKLL
jgi:protein SCO1